MTPFDHHDAVRAVVKGIRARMVEHGFEDHVRRLDSLDLDAVLPASTEPHDLPVLSQFDVAVALADRGPTADLAAGLAGLGHTAPWTQTASYVHDPPSETFLDHYAHATLAGQPDGADGAQRGIGGVSLGLVLLGPRAQYPLHHHPADEMYLPVTEATWAHGAGASYETVAAGALVHHEPWQAHGMRTAGRPLLAIYFWSGDVRTPSRFC